MSPTTETSPTREASDTSRGADPKRARTARQRTGIFVAVALGAGVGLGALLFRAPSKPLLPPASVEVVEVQPRPNVIGAVRDLRVLTTAEQQVERVMDIRSKQSKLFGLIAAEDVLLLVASGSVSAGIDLGELQESDLRVSWDKREVHMKLPPAKILSSKIANDRTYVHTRKTDVLATRAENLEGEARARAEDEIVQAARDAGLLSRANRNAARTMEALLRGLGFREVEVITTDS